MLHDSAHETKIQLNKICLCVVPSAKISFFSVFLPLFSSSTITNKTKNNENRNRVDHYLSITDRYKQKNCHYPCLRALIRRSVNEAGMHFAIKI